jgi:hypothetical protein
MRSPTILLVLFLAVVGGWGSAIYSVDAVGSAAMGDGSWRVWDTGSDAAAGHYALAHYLMRGAVPPAQPLMRSYFASRDAEGSALSSACTYRIALPRLRARWWSLSTVDGDAAIAAVTSESVTTAKDGATEIIVSAQPMPGNWLRAEAGGGLTLRLLAAQDGGAQNAELQLPKIVKGGC